MPGRTLPTTEPRPRASLGPGAGAERAGGQQHPAERHPGGAVVGRVRAVEGRRAVQQAVAGGAVARGPIAEATSVRLDAASAAQRESGAAWSRSAYARGEK